MQPNNPSRKCSNKALTKSEKPPFISWQRSAFNQVNDWAQKFWIYKTMNGKKCLFNRSNWPNFLFEQKSTRAFTMRKIKFKNSFNFCQPIIESRFVLSDRSGTWKFEKICISFQINLKKWQCGLHKLHAFFGFFSPTKYYFDDIKNIQK